VPSVPGTVCLWRLCDGGLRGEVVWRQFVNCFTGLPGFVALAACFVTLWWHTARAGFTPADVAARAPLRWIVLMAALAATGLHFQQDFLSHAWFLYPFHVRAMLAAVNFSLALLGGSTTAVLLRLGAPAPWLRSRVHLLGAMMIWGYMWASMFRMLGRVSVE